MSPSTSRPKRTSAHGPAPTLLCSVAVGAAVTTSKRLLFESIWIIHTMITHAFAANVDLKKRKGAQSFPAPSAGASNCFRCGLKCCLFTSFLKHRDRRLGRALISGPQTQTSSSCHHRYIITGLAAKFQMLIRRARVKLCDSRKQEVLVVLSLCQTTQKFQSSYLDTWALMEKDVLASF